MVKYTIALPRISINSFYLSIFHGFCNAKLFMDQPISVPKIQYVYKLLNHMRRKIHKKALFFWFLR